MPRQTATETAQADETVGEGEVSGTQADAGTGMQRFALPEGKITPIQLKNELVKRGLAPKDIKPQQFYTYVKNPGKTDPFPVKHYDEDGIEYDTPQINDGETRAWTRPGLDLEEGVAWWERRKTRTGTSGKPGGTSGKPRGDGQATTEEGEQPNAEYADAGEVQGEEVDSFFVEAE
jgi:hypothetical protein